MKAALFYGKHDIKLDSVKLNELGPDQVLVKVHACGVCGTDLHIYQGAEGSATVTPPVILGHEFAGEILEIGSRVHGFVVGDRVCIDPNISCGSCYYCQRL